MPDLAIIIPTRGRPENLRKVITAWDFTNAWDYADLILAVDADDPESDGYSAVIHEFNDDVRAIQALVIPRWVPMVEKLNETATDPVCSGYFALGFAGDDHLPQTINWAQRYLTVLRELGTGMVYGDDGYQGAKLSTEWAVTADVVSALGRMVPAPVEHMYCDNSMMDLFGGAGALRHLPEIRIEHMHPIAGKGESDAQYQRVNSREQFSRDRKAYERWVRLELPSQIQMIRSMRPGQPESRPKETPVPTTRPNRAGRIAARSGPTQRKAEMTRFPFTTEFKHVRGATPDEIGMTLADYAVRVPADQEIVELGVFQGRTALIMAWGAKLGHGAHVTGIDPWDLEGNVYDPPFTEADSRRWAEYRINELGYGDAITLIQAFSHDVAEWWIPRPVGLLYVDGDHTKEGARRDIESWAPHLVPGAVIAVDDYGHPDWPGVGQAVDELVAEGFLAPIELFHNRLAVTRLADGLIVHTGETNPEAASIITGLPVETFTAITSEGVEPVPAEGSVEVHLPESDDLLDTMEPVDSAPSDGLDSASLGDLRAKVRGLKANPKGMDRAEMISLIRAAG